MPTKTRPRKRGHGPSTGSNHKHQRTCGVKDQGIIRRGDIPNFNRAIAEFWQARGIDPKRSFND